MRILLLIALFGMSCPTCERDWREKKSPSPWKHEWDYVCVPTAVGIGQTAKDCTEKHPCLLGTPLDLTHIRPLDPEKQCLREGPGHRFEEVRCDAGCEKGEERCPLGHCQKPGIVLVEVWPMSGQSPYKLEQHVCSTCGVVYVPKGDK